MTYATVDDVLAELRLEVERAGGIVAWAKLADLSHTAVSLVTTGARPVTERIANCCGYQEVTVYRRIAKGIA